MFSPASNIRKYNINNNDIIIIGENHLISAPNKNFMKKNNINYTFNYLYDKLLDGYIINLETHPYFKQNEKMYNFYTNLESYNMKNFFNIINKNKNNKLLKSINGIDFRLVHLDDLRLNIQITNYIFDINNKIVVIDYKIIKKIILYYFKQINKEKKNYFKKEWKKLLNYQYKLIKYFNIIDNKKNIIENYIKKYNKMNNTNMTFTIESLNYIKININIFINLIRRLILLYTDLKIITFMINQNKNQVLLIGEAHSNNIYNILKDNIYYNNETKNNIIKIS